MSPMHALRRWPTCAALFGLVAVCSTSVFPAAARPRPVQVDRAGRLETRRRGEHRRGPGAVVEVGVDVPRRGHRPGTHPGHVGGLEVRGELGRDRRRRAPQHTRESERCGRRPVAELGASRALDHHLEGGVHADGVEGTPDGLDEQRPGVSHIAQG